MTDNHVPDDEKQIAQDENPPETAVEFLASLAGLLATVLFIMTFVFQTFAIPSSSMENTLLIGDHVLVDREQFAPPTRWAGPLLPYHDLKRGDIAVFLSPEQPGLFLVKRIIGIPGDRIHLKDDVVYRNGEKLDEPYVKHAEGAGYNPYTEDFPCYCSWATLRRAQRCMARRNAFASGRRRHCRAPQQLLRHGRQPRCEL